MKTLFRYFLIPPLFLITPLLLSFTPVNTLAQSIQFSDATNAAGITPNDPNGYGHGSSFGDFNGDGRPDIYMISYSTANFLFRNNGSTFTDIAGSAGVQSPTQSDRGMAAADYDNDGDLDVYLVQGTMLEPGKSPSEAQFPPPAGWKPVEVFTKAAPNRIAMWHTATFSSLVR